MFYLVDIKNPNGTSNMRLFRSNTPPTWDAVAQYYAGIPDLLVSDLKTTPISVIDLNSGQPLS